MNDIWIEFKSNLSTIKSYTDPHIHSFDTGGAATPVETTTPGTPETTTSVGGNNYIKGINISGKRDNNKHHNINIQYKPIKLSSMK